MPGRWRKYVFVPPSPSGSLLAGPGHELILRDDPGRYALPYELDGRGVGREAAAWLLRTWRRRRAQGGRLWVVRYGGRHEEPRRGQEA